MVDYRLTCMKKSGSRLFRCPDFVIHYKIMRHGNFGGSGAQPQYPRYLRFAKWMERLAQGIADGVIEVPEDH